MLMLMTSCVGLGEIPSLTASDSYCSTYQQIIVTKGEGNITAARSVKNRIAANEKTYICLCSNPQNKICTSK